MSHGMTMTTPEAMLRLAPAVGPLAGRARELNTLRAAWADAVAGRGGVVVVGGEPGVGKTRLAAELAAEVESSGATVLVGRCPAGGADPYHGLVEAIGPLRPVPGSVDRDAMFSAIGDDLVRQSLRAPTLILLDDLHAADRSTCVAVARIAEVVAGSAVLIVGTYRESAVDRSSPLAELLDGPGVAHLVLDGLAPGDLAEIYDDADLARRLWRRSGGNPVVVGELLRLPALDEAGPSALDEMVGRRLDGLDAATRGVLHAAAVVGGEFGVGLVTGVAGLSATRVGVALDRAAAAGFLIAEAGAPPTRRFVHDLVRDAVEQRIDAATRIRLHRRAGRILERAAAPEASPAVLAWHFRAAAPVGPSAGVQRHATRAGDQAMEVLAWEAAAVHYGNALGAAPGASPAVRADLLLALGEAQRLAGETTRARQALLAAAEVARRNRDSRRLARAALGLRQVTAVWGADPVLESLAAEAGTLVGDEPSAAANAPSAPARPALASKAFFASEQLYDALDGVLVDPTRVPEAPPAAARPKDDAGWRPKDDAGRRSKDDGAAAALLRARHAALAGPEHAGDRLATADDMVALAAKTGDHDLAAMASGRRLVDLLELGRLSEAVAEQAVHAAVPGRLGLATHGRDVAAWSAMCALVEGRPTQARAAAAEAYELATDAADPEAATSWLVQRWAVALEWGTVEELVALADECEHVARTGTGTVPQWWRAMAALALARGGENDLAAEALRRATARGLGTLTRDPARLHPLTCLAEVAWRLGDSAAAAALSPMLEPFAGCFVVVGRGLAWQGSAGRAAGLVAATTARWDDAERHLHNAAAAHRRAGAQPLLARTRLEEAGVLAGRGRRGDRRRAAEARRSAAELAARFGMTRLAAEAS